MAELENIRTFSTPYLTAADVMSLLVFDHWHDCIRCLPDEEHAVVEYLRGDSTEAEKNAFVMRAGAFVPLTHVACCGEKCRREYSYERHGHWCTSCHGCFACYVVELLSDQLKADSTPPQQGDAPQ